MTIVDVDLLEVPPISVTVDDVIVAVDVADTPTIEIGTSGPPGPPGVAGVGVESFSWNYDSSATMADPGTGRLRTNTAAGTPATQIAASTWPQSGVDVGNLLRSLTAGDLVFFQEADDSHNWGRYELTGPASDNGGWFLLPVAGVGTAGGTITKNQPLLLRFTYGKAAGPYLIGTVGPIPPADPMIDQIWVDTSNI